MTVLNIDCLLGLQMLADNTVDAIVTDPPYGLSFMGKKWDYDVPSIEIWAECLRVLKPGAHLLAFAGTRTQHRMAVRIEDAGFDIRDMIAWVYGSGFPKHQSALKPALEPITMARKPAPRATLLNIEACRVATDDNLNGGAYSNGAKDLSKATSYATGVHAGEFVQPPGRYPANLIHDGSDEVVALFPDSNGAGGSLPNVKVTGYGDGIGTGASEYLGGERMPFDSGKGSAARFFYCAKASKRDRDEGLDGFAYKNNMRVNGPRDSEIAKTATLRANHHPTVKPADLMRYLCRLVTPPGGVVLDPFAGSGSTGKAAALEGFQFIGFELDPEYVQIANARIEGAKR